MALLNDIVLVKVSIKFDATLGDLSVARQVVSPNEDFWVDLANSTVLPYEYGGTVYYHARVSSLSLTRNSITRAAVVLVAYNNHLGGETPTLIEVAQSGATNNLCYLLNGSGNRIKTYGTLYDGEDQVFRFKGITNSQVGWKLRVPTTMVWSKSDLALLKRVVSGNNDPANGDTDYLSGISDICTDADFNTWLATNLPEYGTSLSIYGHISFAPYDYLSGQRYYVLDNGIQFRLRIYSNAGNNYNYNISRSEIKCPSYSNVETGFTACTSIGNVNSGDANAIVTPSTTSLGGLASTSQKPLISTLYNTGLSGSLAPSASMSATMQSGASAGNIYSTMTFTLTMNADGRLTSFNLTGTSQWSAFAEAKYIAIVQGSGGNKI